MNLLLMILGAVLASVLVAFIIVKYLPLKLRWIPSILLMLLAIFLGTKIYDGIMEPIKFNKEKIVKYAEVVKSLKIIRDAEVKFFEVNGKYTKDKAVLISFIDTAKLALTETKTEVSKQVMGLQHLTIGKVSIKDGIPSLVADFIPPCTSIQSHADLKFTFSEILAFFNMMESHVMHIIQKVHQKKQDNDLAKMVLYMSQNVLIHLNWCIPQFRMQDKYKAPIVMINKLASLARVIKSSLDVYVGTGKEELLKSYLKAFLIQIQRVKQACEQTEGHTTAVFDDKKVQLIKFINLIDENYTKGVTVYEYAKLLFISSRTLSDITNQQLNKTPSKMIQ